jgi:ketosteroid isomerase-like protein
MFSLCAKLMAACLLLSAYFASAGTPVEASQAATAKSAARSSRSAAAKATSEDFSAVMERLRSTWVREFNAGHAENVAALYAPDAVIMRWDGSMHGRESIRALLQKSITNGARDYVVHSLKTERSGVLGYDSGAYNVTLRARVVEGNYLIVVKNIKGRWWIVAHASTPNPEVR